MAEGILRRDPEAVAAMRKVLADSGVLSREAIDALSDDEVVDRLEAALQVMIVMAQHMRDYFASAASALVSALRPIIEGEG